MKIKSDEFCTVFIKKSNCVKIFYNDTFSLLVNTKFSKDTINSVDYKEDKYCSPIILEQNAIFYKNDIVIKEVKIPIDLIRKKTIKNVYLDVLRTPIYELCIVKSKSNIYYLILGSDYCNGINCMEFIGIYNFSGEVIYEGVPDYNKELLKEILLKYEININNKSQVVEIELK
jgi:hypothetical protein